MDLTHPLRSLVPSLDSAVLEVLAGTESGLGSSQIQRLSDRGTRAGQAPVLSRLVEHGLVVAEPTNHGFLYRLNRGHVLVPLIIAAVGMRAEILARLRDEVSSLSVVPVHASVFGSFARRAARAQSDIDILVLASRDAVVEGMGSEFDELEHRVRRSTGNRCQCLVLSIDRARELAGAKEPIVANWLEDGELLLGETLRHLLNS